MTNDFGTSYFVPLVAPIKDELGRIVTPATFIPSCEVSIEQTFQMITCNGNFKILTEQVCNSGDIQTAKVSLLLYVTPCGMFSRRNSKCFVVSSRLVVVDIDHLDSYQEAVEMRSILFNDHLLYPVLTPISPSGRGVRVFVPYDHLPMANDTNSITENMKLATMFTVLLYGIEAPPPFGGEHRGADFSGKDTVRSCFLSHDLGAPFRNNK